VREPFGPAVETSIKAAAEATSKKSKDGRQIRLLDVATF
jgi:hypothetical protein